MIIGPVFAARSNVDDGNPLNLYRIAGDQEICAFNDSYAALSAEFQDPASTGIPGGELRVYALKSTPAGVLSIAGYVKTWASPDYRVSSINYNGSIVPVLGGDYVVQLISTYTSTSPAGTYSFADYCTLVHVDPAGTPSVVQQITTYSKPPGTAAAADENQPYIFPLDDTHLLLIYGPPTPKTASFSVITVTPTGLTVGPVLATVTAPGFYQYCGTPIAGGGLFLRYSNDGLSNSKEFYYVVTYVNGVLTLHGPTLVGTQQPYLSYPGIVGMNVGEFVCMAFDNSIKLPVVNKYKWDGSAVTLLQSVSGTPTLPSLPVQDAAYGNNGGQAGNSRFALIDGVYYMITDTLYDASNTFKYIAIDADLFGTARKATAVDVTLIGSSFPVAVNVGGTIIAYYSYQDGAVAFVIGSKRIPVLHVFPGNTGVNFVRSDVPGPIAVS